MATVDAELIALFNQVGQDRKELTFKKGDKIAFLRRRGDWVEGILNGKRGWLPLKFVKIVDKKTNKEVDQSNLLQAPDPMQIFANSHLDKQEVQAIVSKLASKPEEKIIKQIRFSNSLDAQDGDRRLKRRTRGVEFDTFFTRRPTVSDMYRIAHVSDPDKSKQKKKKRKTIITRKRTVSKVSGMSLEELAEHHASVSNVPLAIKLCLDFIRIHGLETQGIFRVPGHQATVEHLNSEFFQHGMDNVGGINPETDVHVVAEFLKKVLRDLPDPLFTYAYYKKFIDASGLENESEKISIYKRTLAQLPVVHQAVIKSLFLVLVLISQNAKSNLMDTENLATIFGPTLLREKPSERSDILKALEFKSSLVVRDFMVYYESIFGEKIKKDEEGNFHEKRNSKLKEKQMSSERIERSKSVSSSSFKIDREGLCEETEKGSGDGKKGSKKRNNHYKNSSS